MKPYIVQFPDGRVVGSATTFLDAKRMLDARDDAPPGAAVVRTCDGVVLARKGASMEGLAVKMMNNQAGRADGWFT